MENELDERSIYSEINHYLILSQGPLLPKNIPKQKTQVIGEKAEPFSFVSEEKAEPPKVASPFRDSPKERHSNVPSENTPPLVSLLFSDYPMIHYLGVS